MKFHQQIQNQMWQSCTAIMYESICNFCLTANIIFYIHAESCMSFECILQSPDVILYHLPTDDPQVPPKVTIIFFWGGKECALFSVTPQDRERN